MAPSDMSNLFCTRTLASQHKCVEVDNIFLTDEMDTEDEFYDDVDDDSWIDASEEEEEENIVLSENSSFEPSGSVYVQNHEQREESILFYSTPKSRYSGVDLIINRERVKKRLFYSETTDSDSDLN